MMDEYEQETFAKRCARMQKLLEEFFKDEPEEFDEEDSQVLEDFYAELHNLDNAMVDLGTEFNF